MFEGADGSLGGKGTQLVGVEGGQEGRSDGVEFLSPIRRAAKRSSVIDAASG